MSVTVGATVRLGLPGSPTTPLRSIRAMVSTVDDTPEGPVLDLVTDDGKDVCGVPLDAVQPLFPFELVSIAAASYDELMEQGRVLYKDAGDFGAAMERFEAAAGALEAPPAPIAPTARPAISVGARVLVSTSGGCRAAVVSCLDGDTVDVMFDEDSGKDEEEDGVALSRVSVLGDGSGMSGREAAANPEALRSQLAAHLNVVRCALRVAAWEPAKRHADIGVCVASAIDSAVGTSDAVVPALFLQAKVRLAVQDFKVGCACARV